jgi:hypothetical protein
MRSVWTRLKDVDEMELGTLWNVLPLPCQQQFANEIDFRVKVLRAAEEAKIWPQPYGLC